MVVGIVVVELVTMRHGCAHIAEHIFIKHYHSSACIITHPFWLLNFFIKEFVFCEYY